MTTVDRASALVTTSTASRGSSQVMDQIFSNGLLLSSSNAQGHLFVQQYDGLGRLTGVSDPRVGLSSIEYHANTVFPW